jgi:hypothetical protein
MKMKNFFTNGTIVTGAHAAAIGVLFNPEYFRNPTSAVKAHDTHVYCTVITSE